LLLRLANPIVWFVNLFVSALIKLMRLDKGNEDSAPLSPEELRVLVLEAGHFIDKKHHSILMNLFELQNITVDDVMTPRNQIEAIDINADQDILQEQLATAHHTRIPVYAERIDNILGVIHVRKVLHLAREELSAERIKSIWREPYFIPAGTPLFTQLQQFQEGQRRLGLVVDEYGELMGLVTIEDILEEIIGEFTSASPSQRGNAINKDDAGYLIEGASLLRDLNRKLGCHFPLDGPKTLNGLILEHFQDIPEDATCLEISGHRMEVVQTQDRQVRVVKIYFPGKAS
jgi:Mg2+/Co2+ transporter CorB